MPINLATQCLFEGNIFLNLSKIPPILSPATTNVTDVITNISPINMRVVMTS